MTFRYHNHNNQYKKNDTDNGTIDTELTINIIKRMQQAKIGNYAKWTKMIKKVSKHRPLNEYEQRYFATFTRIYKKGKITPRTKIFHIKLSEEDSKPKCSTCQLESSFYCNQNDAYFCKIHVIGHDENER